VPAEFLDRIDDSETTVPIGSLAGAEDTVLLAAAKSGSGQVFEVLIERHARRILCLAQRLTGNRDDGEDIVQQSFQKAFVQLQKFEGRSSRPTWFTRIAINEVLMCRRRSSRASAASLGELNAGEEAALPLPISDSDPSPELTPPVRTAIQLCKLDERLTQRERSNDGSDVWKQDVTNER
jgi:DNA-directed RNA polymerase specialized sigma24 family protein